MRKQHHQGEGERGEHRGHAHALRGISGLNVVELGKHGDSGGTWHACHCGCHKDVGFVESAKLCKQADQNGKRNQLERGVQIQTAIGQHFGECDGCKQCARDQHRNRRAEIAKIGHEFSNRFGEYKDAFEQIQYNSDGARDGSVIEECLLGCHANIFSSTCENDDSPRPKKEVERDHVECTHEAAFSLAKDRIENRESDKSAVGKYQGEFKNLHLIHAVVPTADQISNE